MHFRHLLLIVFPSCTLLFLTNSHTPIHYPPTTPFQPLIMWPRTGFKPVFQPWLSSPQSFHPWTSVLAKRMKTPAPRAAIPAATRKRFRQSATLLSSATTQSLTRGTRKLDRAPKPLTTPQTVPDLVGIEPLTCWYFCFEIINLTLNWSTLWSSFKQIILIYILDFILKL